MNEVRSGSQISFLAEMKEQILLAYKLACVCVSVSAWQYGWVQQGQAEQLTVWGLCKWNFAIGKILLKYTQYFLFIIIKNAYSRTILILLYMY